MKVLTVTGKNEHGELQEFHIINPRNVLLNKGIVEVAGELSDSNGNSIPVKEEVALLQIGGRPLFSTESVEEIYERVKEL
jgi:hypothetical protein